MKHLFHISPTHDQNKGIVLVLVMILLTICTCMAIPLATYTNTNLKIADNYLRANRARASAESGLEIVRFWMSQVSIPQDTEPIDRLTALNTSLLTVLSNNHITNLQPELSGSCIVIPSVYLDADLKDSFSTVFHQTDDNTIQVTVSGWHGTFSRRISVDYVLQNVPSTAFDFGVATRGPLSLGGNVQLDGVNLAVESNAYIESINNIIALEIKGNSQIMGNVKIVNPMGTVDLQGGQASIGGETGQAAIDHHVTFDAPFTDFPEPDPTGFESYATNILDESTDTNSDVELENLRIPADMNPIFSGHATLKGVVYIETPNVVTFTGGVDITGLIITNGEWTDDTETSQLIFRGHMDSYSVSELPNEPQFEGLHGETGTFIMAPGFKLDFGGSFSVLSGAIAGNGVVFGGGAGGIIEGSVINYSDSQMSLQGNTDIYFNRSGLEQVPAGFVSNFNLVYDPASYSEI
jgi:hypothetical protein